MKFVEGVERFARNGCAVQVEPALRALRQAVRENRINCEDLAPLTEEARAKANAKGKKKNKKKYCSKRTKRKKMKNISTVYNL